MFGRRTQKDRRIDRTIVLEGSSLVEKRLADEIEKGKGGGAWKAEV
jgi:hypothetical protein